MPLVSVIVPVYNVASYLNKCVDSLVCQTHKELEIILIDDGSTDGSGELCDQRARQDSCVKVIHSENYGVSHARNLGLMKAHGDYIGFVDADDWIEPDMYESMLQYMKKWNSDIHVGGYVKETAFGPERELRIEEPQVFSREEGLRKMMEVNNRKLPLFRGHLWDKLFSRYILEGLFLNEDLKLREDTWLVWQAFKRSDRISYAPQFSYHYVMRNDSATHISMKRENGTYMDAMKLIFDDMAGLSSETGDIVKIAYEVEWLNVMKSILSLKENDFEDVFRQGHIEIRQNLFSILRDDAFSNRQKIGFLYFSLPEIGIKIGKLMVQAVLKHKGRTS